MILSVHDRLMLLSVLPKEGNFLTLKIIRKAREALSFTEPELKALKIQQVKVEGGEDQIRWEEGAVADKEVPLGDTVKAVVIKELKRLDETNKLSMDHVPLFEKFVNS